ncbi:MAG: type II toxin-antitoxin system prevent-host-death family antitoxin [Bacteroidetes bacterium SW_9_63_38]|nr:MAG: type II toxin-antitoxin system prevent-host-death family antitoxin [Bacteroidetes bacterium SW_9_63_38]
MTQIPVQEAQGCLESLLDRAEKGETILITRSGRPPIRLHPTEGTDGNTLPSLSEWREELQVEGAPLRENVQRRRDDERY